MQEFKSKDQCSMENPAICRSALSEPLLETALNQGQIPVEQVQVEFSAKNGHKIVVLENMENGGVRNSLRRIGVSLVAATFLLVAGLVALPDASPVDLRLMFLFCRP